MAFRNVGSVVFRACLIHSPFFKLRAEHLKSLQVEKSDTLPLHSQNGQALQEHRQKRHSLHSQPTRPGIVQVHEPQRPFKTAKECWTLQIQSP